MPGEDHAEPVAAGIDGLGCGGVQGGGKAGEVRRVAFARRGPAAEAGLVGPPGGFETLELGQLGGDTGSFHDPGIAGDERLDLGVGEGFVPDAVISREGVCVRLLLAARAGRYRLVVSPLLLDELSAVLARPKLRRYLSVEDARRFVEVIRELTDVVDDPPDVDQPITDDPDDDFLVVLAEAVGADVLVSGDPHLTTLQRPGLTVMTPRRVLDALNA